MEQDHDDRRSRVEPSGREDPAGSKDAAPVRIGGLDALAVLELQRSAGNAGVAALLQTRGLTRTIRPSVQRWTNPLLTLKSDEQLIRDGINDRDMTAIRSVKNYNATNSEDDKLKMIDLLLSDAWIVSDALRRLWQTFDDPSLERIVAAKPDRWAASVKRDSDLKTVIPLAKTRLENFPEEVRATAEGYLTTNLQVTRQQQIQLGLLTFDNGGKPAPMTDENRSQIAKLQAAAAAIAKLQVAQEAARKIVVGWSSFPVMSAAGDVNYGEVEFSPYKPPETEQRPSGPGHDPTRPHQPYALVKAKYDKASEEIAKVLRQFPALYAVSRLDSSAQTTAFSKIADPTKARAQLGRGLDALVADIQGAQKNLKKGGTLEPLDLIPVHQRLIAGAKSDGATTVTDWSKPLAAWAAREAARDHELDEALKSLGLELAIQAAFLLAPFTGGASLLFVTLGALAQAGKTMAAEDKFDALAQAAKTSVTPGTEIVDEASVDAAAMTATAEEIALALAVLAVGAEAVSATIKAIKGPEVPAPEADAPPAPKGSGLPVHKVPVSEILVDAKQSGSALEVEFSFDDPSMGTWRLGNAEVTVDAQGVPRARMSLNGRATIGGQEHAVRLVDASGNDVSVTRYAIDTVRSQYQSILGQEVMGFDGQLASQNLRNFRLEFGRARANLAGANPAMAPAELNEAAAQQAVRRISFGTHREAAGYANFRVELGDLVEVDFGGTDGVMKVPSTVDVTADLRPLSVPASE